ncbi:hypothetical protein ACSO1_18260 [Acinetobacter calcoaceticus]|nr:hypothetical protein ACSO1_18260 [Acinetobacter calcoaceticus]
MDNKIPSYIVLDTPEKTEITVAACSVKIAVGLQKHFPFEPVVIAVVYEINRIGMQINLAAPDLWGVTVCQTNIAKISYPSLPQKLQI